MISIDKGRTMTRNGLWPGASLVGAALLLLAAGCSDSGEQDPDLGGRADGAVDQQGTTKDGKPPKPDGPKKPASWVTIGGTAPAVWSHSATALKDGRVLIAGGTNTTSGSSGKALAQSYLYDPKTNSFKPAGKMKAARYGHEAVLLDSGRVLVVGGRLSHYSPLASAELFDPKRPAASAWSSAGSMGGPRVTFAMARLNDGRVLVVGGLGKKAWEPLASLELYIPKSNSWSTMGLKLKAGRSLTTATTLPGGKVLIAGGYNGTKHLASLVIYDPASGTLQSQKSSLGKARALHSASRMGDGRVLLVGGFCGAACDLPGDEIYNPTTGKISSISHAGAPPSSHAATVLKDGRVLVTGGAAKADGTKAVVFDPAGGGIWTTLPAFKFDRELHTATLLPDGSVLLVGGRSGAGSSAKPASKAERLHHP